MWVSLPCCTVLLHIPTHVQPFAGHLDMMACLLIPQQPSASVLYQQCDLDTYMSNLVTLQLIYLSLATWILKSRSNILLVCCTCCPNTRQESVPIMSIQPFCCSSPDTWATVLEELLSRTLPNRSWVIKEGKIKSLHLDSFMTSCQHPTGPPKPFVFQFQCLIPPIPNKASHFGSSLRHVNSPIHNSWLISGGDTCHNPLWHQSAMSPTYLYCWRYRMVPLLVTWAALKRPWVAAQMGRTQFRVGGNDDEQVFARHSHVCQLSNHIIVVCICSDNFWRSAVGLHTHVWQPVFVWHSPLNHHGSVLCASKKSWLLMAF